MHHMIEIFLIYLISSVFIFYILKKVFFRLQLSRAKHPSLRGHSKLSRRIARLVPYFEYDENDFYCSDGAPESIAHKRQKGLELLVDLSRKFNSGSNAFSTSLEESVSDVDFTSAYRVPFPYRKFLNKELKTGRIVDKTKGVKIKDIDNNWRFDLSGSYGVNVFGYDFYRDCMEKGFEKVKQLGPVLGAYHPIIRENVEKLKLVSGLDEVSFHMSGTEAVMQAVRLARYHTGKTHLVRFCGAYHGWWDGVQPGIGNQRKTNDVYTLRDRSDITLKVLSTRNDIACVLINPIQAFHPNFDAPSDTTLISSDRSTNYDRGLHTHWLEKLREVCTRKKIVLIFDEVFSGFRLGYRGAQEYFGVQADMVTYGKTLGGGLPIGVVCGQHKLMKRFRDDSPANISFARGTFNSHPYVMGSMNEFLNRIEAPEYQLMYQQADELWNKRVEKLNQRLIEENLPVHVANMHSVLTVLYSVPSRYNWMLQFYLHAEGLDLSWIGSGRMIMSFNFSDDDFSEVIECFVRAAKKMKNDCWWWQDPHLSNKAIKRQMFNEMILARFPFIGKIIQKKIPGCTNETIKGVY